MIRTFFVAAIGFAYILLVGTPVVIYSLLVGNARLVYRVGRWGCRMVVWLAGIKIAVEGKEKIPAHQAVVYMPNHQSYFDPPAIISILPRLVVMPKKEVFRVPMLGRAMLQCGFIPVDRKNRERALAAIEEAVKALKTGRSFLVFPEGTRSPDGRLQPFKKGAFAMALEAQVPIVPVSISGASRIMRKGQLAIHPGTMRITIHDPIPTQGYTKADRGVVMELVRMAVLAELTEAERPLPAPPKITRATAMHGIASGGRHEVAAAHGFKRVDVDGEFVLYEHPERGLLHTFSDGSWKYVAPDGTEASGSGATDLAQYLSVHRTGAAKPN